MLVLSRKVGETIIINNNITVKVVGIQGDRVKLGIIAPKEVEIFREEVLERKKAKELNENH